MTVHDGSLTFLYVNEIFISNQFIRELFSPSVLGQHCKKSFQSCKTHKRNENKIKRGLKIEFYSTFCGLFYVRRICMKHV